MASVVLALSAVSAVSALAGCGSDDADGAAPEDPTSSAASSPEPTGSTPAKPEGPEPATGRRVETQTVVYHLPAGIDWNIGMGGSAANWWDDRTNGPWDILQFEHNEREPKDLGEIARTSLAGARSEYPTVERLDNRVVNGVEGWVLEYHGKDSLGSPRFHYEFGAVTGTYWTTFNFDFPKDNARTRAVIDAVLASIEWKLKNDGPASP